MSNAITGGVTLSLSFVQQLDAGAARLNAYPVPVQPAVLSSYTSGTGALQVNRLAQGSGTTTISTPVDLNLATLACVDGSTGFSHVREVLIFNDDATNPLTVGDDGVVTDAWVAYSAGTSARFTVQPGSFLRISKPLGTNGYTVDSTHKNLRIDPGSAAVAYRYVVAGD